MLAVREPSIATLLHVTLLLHLPLLENVPHGTAGVARIAWTEGFAPIAWTLQAPGGWADVVINVVVVMVVVVHMDATAWFSRKRARRTSLRLLLLQLLQLPRRRHKLKERVAESGVGVHKTTMLQRNGIAI